MNGTSKMGLGTVEFGLDYGISNTGGKPSYAEVGDILREAERRHIEIIDTASAYGNAEEILGSFKLSGFKLVSKFMPPSHFGKSISEQLVKSLSLLGLDSLYGYLAHRPEDLYHDRQQWDTLLKLKEEGKIQKIGFSMNDPSDLEKLMAVSIFPDLIQVPFNYFDYRFKDQIIALKESGCEIHARSVFLQGIFFMDPDFLNSYFDEIKPFLKRLQDNSFLAGSLLKFVMEKPFIDRVIIGVQSRQQLKQNIMELERATSLPEFNQILSDQILIPALWPKLKRI